MEEKRVSIDLGDPNSFKKIYEFSKQKRTINDGKCDLVFGEEKNLGSLKGNNSHPWCYPRVATNKPLTWNELGGMLSKFKPDQINLIVKTVLRIMRAGRDATQDNDDDKKTTQRLLEDVQKIGNAHERHYTALYMVAQLIGAGACEAGRGHTGFLNVLSSLNRIKQYSGSEENLKTYIKEIFPGGDPKKAQHDHFHATSFEGSESIIQKHSGKKNFKKPDKQPQAEWNDLDGWYGSRLQGDMVYMSTEASMSESGKNRHQGEAEQERYSRKVVKHFNNLDPEVSMQQNPQSFVQPIQIQVPTSSFSPQSIIQASPLSSSFGTPPIIEKKELTLEQKSQIEKNREAAIQKLKLMQAQPQPSVVQQTKQPNLMRTTNQAPKASPSLWQQSSAPVQQNPQSFVQPIQIQVPTSSFSPQSIIQASPLSSSFGTPPIIEKKELTLEQKSEIEKNRETAMQKLKLMQAQPQPSVVQQTKQPNLMRTTNQALKTSQSLGQQSNARGQQNPQSAVKSVQLSQSSLTLNARQINQMSKTPPSLKTQLDASAQDQQSTAQRSNETRTSLPLNQALKASPSLEQQSNAPAQQNVQSMAAPQPIHPLHLSSTLNEPLVIQEEQLLSQSMPAQQPPSLNIQSFEEQTKQEDIGELTNDHLQQEQSNRPMDWEASTEFSITNQQDSSVTSKESLKRPREESDPEKMGEKKKTKFDTSTTNQQDSSVTPKESLKRPREENDQEKVEDKKKTKVNTPIEKLLQEEGEKEKQCYAPRLNQETKKTEASGQAISPLMGQAASEKIVLPPGINDGLGEEVKPSEISIEVEDPKNFLHGSEKSMDKFLQEQGKKEEQFYPSMLNQVAHKAEVSGQAIISLPPGRTASKSNVVQPGINDGPAEKTKPAEIPMDVEEPADLSQGSENSIKTPLPNPFSGTHK